MSLRTLDLDLLRRDMTLLNINHTNFTPTPQAPHPRLFYPPEAPRPPRRDRGRELAAPTYASNPPPLASKSPHLPESRKSLLPKVSDPSPVSPPFCYLPRLSTVALLTAALALPIASRIEATGPKPGATLDPGVMLHQLWSTTKVSDGCRESERLIRSVLKGVDNFLY